MKIIIQSLLICFTLTTSLYLGAMESELETTPDECRVDWEAFGAKVRLNRTLGIKLKEGAPQEVCCLLHELNTIRNRYYYGAALDVKIDEQLQEKSRTIYAELHQWNLAHTSLPQWKLNIDHYVTSLSLTRLAGAFEIARFYYRCYFERMMSHIRTYLDNRVRTLSQDPQASQALVGYYYSQLRMTVFQGELNRLQRTGTQLSTSKHTKMQHEIEKVICTAQKALNSINSSKLDHDNLTHEAATLRKALENVLDLADNKID